MQTKGKFDWPVFAWGGLYAEGGLYLRGKMLQFSIC